MMCTIKKIHAVLIVCCVLAVFITLGCGKKGPPVPPFDKSNVVAPPYDLEFKVTDSRLSLTWKHQTNAEKARIEPDGFEVFMARKTFEECEGCPFVFKLIGFVSMPDKVFSVPVETGYKYYFRVQAMDEEGIRSGYSKTVQFESK